MLPSLSTLERGNPPPRRKSCAACTKAKRRCDLRQPSCLRCSQRRLECSYPAHSRRQRNADEYQPSSATEVPPSVHAGQCMPQPTPAPEVSSWEVLDFDFNMNLERPCQLACPSFQPITFDDPSVQGLGFLDDMVGAADSVLSTISAPPKVHESLPLTLLHQPNPSDVSVARLQTFKATSQVIEQRFSYAMDEFIRAPETMVLENRTPWSHPALYRESMPACMEDALASCALHRAKNPINRSVIQRIIQSNYHALLTSPIPTSSGREALARTHALLLYQIILFFEPSHAARAEAEETSSALADSAMALLQHVRYDSEETITTTTRTDTETASHATPPIPKDIPLYPLATARAAFADWAFQESLRRTLLISFFFLQMQRLMCALYPHPHPFPLPPPPPQPHSTTLEHDDAYCDPRLGFCRSFTLSAHLWGAVDAVAFAVAWRGRRHLVATPRNFGEVLERAAADDVEEFGKMLISTALGVEETRGWFASKGGVL